MIYEGIIEDGIRAAAEALFPENDLGAPDWRETEIVRRTLEYIEELPPQSRILVRALFTFVELSGPALVREPSRFSRLPVWRRLELVQGWRESSFTPLKIVGDALKAALTMIYMSHPAALAYIGYYKGHANPADPLQVEVRPGAAGRLSKGRPG